MMFAASHGPLSVACSGVGTTRVHAYANAQNAPWLSMTLMAGQCGRM
jgi:hypothetical protein